MIFPLLVEVHNWRSTDCWTVGGATGFAIDICQPIGKDRCIEGKHLKENWRKKSPVSDLISDLSIKQLNF
jgi:hypothetical protein